MADVSVLVPSFNHARFIERTLRSIFAQTLRPKKLIVIDDGSKDESAAIIRRVLQDCPFENEFIARENRGLSATLNEGLAKTAGEYFAYIGSDDVWLRTFLAEQIKLLDTRNNAVLAFSHAYVINESDFIIDRTDNWSAFADGDMLPFLLRGVIFSSPTVIYRRSAVEKYGWNEDSILEDYELYLRLSGEGEFARNEKILAAWRLHGANASDNYPLMLNEWLKAQNRVADSLPMTREELDKIQEGLKFDSVFGCIRNGYRREAAELFWQNKSGARSLSQIARMLLRFAIPTPLFQWNRRRKCRNAIRKYGKLQY